MTGMISALALLSLLSAGPKVAVFGFDGVGVDSVTAFVATTVFRTELGNTGKFVVASTDEIVGVLGADKVVTKVSDAQDAARRIGAAKVVIGSLSRLGTQTIGTVKLIDVTGGSIEFEDQLATTSRDELDIVLRRLAKAVATKTKASTDVELGEITEKESKEVNRKQAFFGGGVALGVGVTQGMKAASTSIHNQAARARHVGAPERRDGAHWGISGRAAAGAACPARR